MKNWKNRYFVVKGCTVCYFDDEISETKVLLPEALQALKGSHLITSVEDTREEGGLGWRINTEQNKEFLLRGHNESSRRDALEAMKRAADIYAEKKQRQSLDTPPRLFLALQLCEFGALMAAIPILQQLAADSPPSALLHFHLGTALLTAGDISGAANSLKTSLELQADNDDAEIHLAAALIAVTGKESRERAKKHLRNVLQRTNNSNTTAAHNLATILVSESRLEEARELLSYALQCEPDNCSLYVSHAEVLFMLSQAPAAIDSLRSGLTHCQQSSSRSRSNIYTRLGQMLLSGGEENAGIAHLQEAVDINPKNSEAMYLLEMAIKRREEDSELLFDEWMARTLQQQQKQDEEEKDVRATLPPTPSLSIGSKPEKRQSIFGSIFNNNIAATVSSSPDSSHRRGSSFV